MNITRKKTQQIATEYAAACHLYEVRTMTCAYLCTTSPTFKTLWDNPTTANRLRRLASQFLADARRNGVTTLDHVVVRPDAYTLFGTDTIAWNVMLAPDITYSDVMRAARHAFVAWLAAHYARKKQ
jgi:hypothetical protein